MKSLLAEELLNSAKKIAEAAEVFEFSSQEVPVAFEANNLKQIQSKESYSLALRIIKGGRIGFASTNGTGTLSSHSEKNREIVNNLLNMAVETSQFGFLSNFNFSPHNVFPKVSIYDRQVEKISMEEMLGLGNLLITKVKQCAPDILCDVEVNKGSNSIHIINTQGGEASYTKSFFGINIEGVITNDTDMLFVGDSEVSCHASHEFNGVADRVITQLEMARKKATASTKSLPVIFTPRGIASTFYSPLALAFNGKTNLEGVSPLSKRLGESIFNKTLSLYDDATADYCLGSSPCDDEGVPSQKTMLINEGVVENFIYDLQTAASAGFKSTGNGNRSGAGIPKPGMNFLVIKEGTTSFQDMIADIKEGLLVEQLMGAEQGNILGGDFGGNILLGYKIEDGEIIGRVKDTMIAGNIYQVLKQPLEIGSVARDVDGKIKTPHLYCPRLSVSARGV